jgi:HEXXH motif-containing protein
VLRALAELPDTAEVRRFLLGSQLSGWIHGVEQSLGLIETSRASLAEVFEKVAATTHLLELVPAGAAPKDLPLRARNLGQELLRRRLQELPLLVWGWIRPAEARRGTIFLREDSEQGIPAGELWLGGGTCVLSWSGPRRPRSVTYEFGPRGLKLKPGRNWEPAAISNVGNSDVRIGHVIVSGARALRVAGRSGAAELRLGRALALIDAAWPVAGGWLRRRTDRVVPLIEPGTISYSLRTRPGVSFICAGGKTVLELADDLVHENAHHELHWREELGELERSDGSPNYYSPWRRSMRPLRGILHGCFTFLRRAELFIRLLAASRRRAVLAGVRISSGRRRFLARGVLEECSALEFSLADVERAARRGELTPGGKKLLLEMQTDLSRLRRQAALLRRRLARGGAMERALLVWETEDRAQLRSRTE